jgi:endoglucanase
MKELIKQLVEAYGPAGHEDQVRALIEGMIRPYVDETRVDAMGNLIALKKGTGGGKRIMIAAHMDEIGLVATYIDKKGYVRFAPAGGLMAPWKVGHRVRFCNGVEGVVGWEKWLDSQALPTYDEMFVDVGATSSEDCPVQVGDAAMFVQPMVDLGQRIVAKAMDDRIACAVAMQVLMELKSTPHDVYVVFTTQEELGTRGAMVAAYGVEPEVAVAVDVTKTGDTPEAKPMAVTLGGGPAVKIMDAGFIAHGGLKAWMIATAERLGIPYQREVLSGGSTDARAMQLARGGVPAGCLSIPCRYVHTPSEMVDYGDVLDAVKLLIGMLEGPIPF